MSHGSVTRWAAGDGALSAPDGSSIDEAACLAAMPEVGVYEVEVGGEAYPVERVGSRYCSLQDLAVYGLDSDDRFDDPGAYAEAAMWSAIQAAEEAIEDGCRRSFCERARDVHVDGALPFEDLPEVDVRSVSGGRLVRDRMIEADGPMDVRMVYGARADESIRRACVKLAAYYLRPRVGSENARGQSVDGVYVSFELATGEEGSWTGLPEVDAVIERHRSRRAVVM